LAIAMCTKKNHITICRRGQLRRAVLSKIEKKLIGPHGLLYINFSAAVQLKIGLVLSFTSKKLISQAFTGSSKNKHHFLCIYRTCI